MSSSAFWAALGVGASIGLYCYVKNAYSYWARKGIRGPSEWWPKLVGTLLGLSRASRTMSDSVQWPKEYGKVYGLYRGLRPNLVIADAQVLHQICITDFDAFTNHEFNEFFNHYQKDYVFNQQDQHWRRARAIMAPLAASCKIERMYRSMGACVDDLIRCLQSATDWLPSDSVGELLGGGSGSGSGSRRRWALVNMRDVCNLFAMDATSNCCYGLKLDTAQSSDLKSAAAAGSEWLRSIMATFERSRARSLLAGWAPKPLLRLLAVEAHSSAPDNVLAITVRQLIGERRDPPNSEQRQRQRHDYLQLLMDAKLDDPLELTGLDSAENHHAGLSNESARADQARLVTRVSSGGVARARQADTLNEHEIVAGALFPLRTAETVASLLTHCVYLMSFHPDVQTKLYEEIKSLADSSRMGPEPSGGGGCTRAALSYEALTSCSYLDAVISESLRYLSPVFSVDRIAGRDYRIEKYNLDIPKGCLVTAALHSIMNDADYWPEPTRFDPSRFLPGNREKIAPGSYCPFGIGPRHCLGMRFSLTQSKLALASIVMRHRFEPAPGAKFPPELSRRVGAGANVVKPPNVILIPR